MPTVFVHSLNQFGEIEWTEVFEAKTIGAARGKATKWIKANVFDTDYELNRKYSGEADCDTWFIE